MSHVSVLNMFKTPTTSCSRMHLLRNGTTSLLTLITSLQPSRILITYAMKYMLGGFVNATEAQRTCETEAHFSTYLNCATTAISCFFPSPSAAENQAVTSDDDYSRLGASGPFGGQFKCKHKVLHVLPTLHRIWLVRIQLRQVWKGLLAGQILHEGNTTTWALIYHWSVLQPVMDVRFTDIRDENWRLWIPTDSQFSWVSFGVWVHPTRTRLQKKHFRM